jgi:hypothetical protein
VAPTVLQKQPILQDLHRRAPSDPSDEHAQQAMTTHIVSFDPAVAELSDIETALRTAHRASTLF